MAFHKSLLKFFLFGIFVVFISRGIVAQNYQRPEKFHNYWKVTFHGGPSIFYGDIKQNKWLPITSNVNELRFAGGVNLEFQFSAPVSIGLQAIYGNLSGTRRSWGIYFMDDYIETNFFININFSNLFFGYKRGRFFQAYGVFGGGFMQYNTQQKDLESDKVIKSRGNGSGKGIKGRTLEGILTYGLGINFRLSRNWALNLQSVNRIMKSDELDAYKNSYPYDVYNYTSVGFVYKFGPSRKKTVKPKPKTKPEPIELPPSEAVVTPLDTASVTEKTTEIKTVEPAEPVVVSEEIQTEETVSPPVSEGLNYRVQILARFSGPLSVEQISSMYKIPASDISEDTYEGHFIYTIGRFETYDEARIKRDEVRYYYGIKDAFVVAFDMGKRLDKLPADN
ncbi:MAG: hypothetical protein GXO86_13990 [Chlorobi bacterium]|nr:hypothetical protein [Chlorobiota bacterium]